MCSSDLLPRPRPEDLAALRAALEDDGADPQAARRALVALARLGARLATEERAGVEAALAARLAHPAPPAAEAAAGGLVRLWLADEGKEPETFDPTFRTYKGPV